MSAAKPTAANQQEGATGPTPLTRIGGGAPHGGCPVGKRLRRTAAPGGRAASYRSPMMLSDSTVAAFARTRGWLSPRSGERGYESDTLSELGDERWGPAASALSPGGLAPF